MGTEDEAEDERQELEDESRQHIIRVHNEGNKQQVQTRNQDDVRHYVAPLNEPSMY